jgi:cell wall-associated NlpC family hydrolase
MLLHTVRSHRRALPRPLKNKWLTASVGVATAGLLAVGVVAAPSVFAADSAKMTLARYNTAATIKPSSVGYLRSTVKTPDGQPIADTAVTLYRTVNGKWGSLMGGKTDSQGVVTFRIAPSISSYYAVHYAGGQVTTTPPATPPATPPSSPATPEPSSSPSGSTDTSTGSGATSGNGSTSGSTSDTGNGSTGSDTSNTTPVSNTNATTKTLAATMSPAIPIYVQSGGAAVVTAASKYRGKPYRYGAAGPNSFDCSGFTQFIYKKFGKSLPHSATSQSRYGSAIGRSAMKPGDLLFFGKPGSYYHVAIYAGGNTMWDAPTSGQTVGSHKIWSNNYTVRRLVV